MLSALLATTIFRCEGFCPSERGKKDGILSGEVLVRRDFVQGHFVRSPADIAVLTAYSVAAGCCTVLSLTLSRSLQPAQVKRTWLLIRPAYT